MTLPRPTSDPREMIHDALGKVDGVLNTHRDADGPVIGSLLCARSHLSTILALMAENPGWRTAAPAAPSVTAIDPLQPNGDPLIQEAPAKPVAAE